MSLNWANSKVGFSSSMEVGPPNILKTRAKRILLTSELRGKDSHFANIIIPKLGILDFNSKGILQPRPSWNLIVIPEESSTLSTVPSGDEALIL